MKRIKLSFLSIVVLVGGLSAVGKTQAAHCMLVTGPQENGQNNLDASLFPVEVTFPFAIARLTGSAEPVGATLYSGYLINALYSGFTCDTPPADGRFYLSMGYESAPLGVWTGDIGQYSGKIYNTGIDGIGFVVKPQDLGVFGYYDSDVLPVTGARYLFDGGRGLSGNILPGAEYAFIKTGPIAYGTIEGAKLPTIVSSMKVEDLNVTLYRMRFTGSITINKPTCHSTETDKVVPLGTWHVRDFANTGDTSPWVDSSLTMVCDDDFWGGSGAMYDVQLENEDTLNIITKTYSFPSSANTWAVRFTSTTGLIDATQGIIALDSSNGDSASGVGIQLSSSASAAGVMDLTTGWGGTIELGERAFRVPIFARYVRTGAVTAGSANGKVIYTVDYQ